MTQSRSLQKTLGIGLTLGAILLWIMAISGAILVSQNKLNELFDSALAETAQRIMPLAVVEIMNRDETGLPQNIMSFETHDEPLTYLVRNRSGKILLQSHNAEPSIFNQVLLEGFNTSGTHRLYGAWAVQKTIHIEIAEPLSQRKAAITEMAITLLWPLILIIPLCFIGTWAFVHYSLRRILIYRNEIESRGSGDLSPVSVTGLPTEILTIAEPVNDLLDRLRRALESERSFTANSAHELRTPIATALAQIQRLEKELPEGDSKERAFKIEKTVRTLSNLSEKLMQLAKAEGGGLFSNEQHDLTSIIQLVTDDLRRSSNVKIIEYFPPESLGIKSKIDPDAFAILVRNLLDNAIKHGSQNQPVEIHFSRQDELRIVNAGNIVPAEHLAKLRQRFVRSKTTAHGSGLGLAIADAIVTGIGASMLLNSPATGRPDGFEVVITLSDS
ncbi:MULTISPECIES: HAMP domain-containing sensor histidine kinase [unclassified Neptuniibacter]|uniref:sensor histidine kinase n=1 Tax=unclassified Neptuniibacter TaxID=2630693 RepID=UPI000C37BCBA|nr:MULTISPECIES: HAMP domain-containing sensor histidine kinase [unclassified Neptuniibacter]MAY42049.1 two-component sensor histidine kinase [Oceanospirillaceae bacterium]|tara:strand:- start:17833 stop:19164 length:1332 start_codon:yes stop_codon:yes gene_type:complete